MALRGRRLPTSADGLGGPSYKFPQFLTASGICGGALALPSAVLGADSRHSCCRASYISHIPAVAF